MADSFSKKQQNKKKIEKQKEKESRRESRKSENNKGKSLDEMIVYVDVNGNFTSVPPHLQDREADLARAEQQRIVAVDPETEFTGTVTFVSDKGYGFITEDNSRENIYFHQNDLGQALNKYDKVSYRVETSFKGNRAVDIKINK